MVPFAAVCSGQRGGRGPNEKDIYVGFFQNIHPTSRSVISFKLLSKYNTFMCTEAPR
jgi:hypothetical protein